VFSFVDFFALFCVMANDYDRIFKENIENLIPFLAERILGIKAETLIELPDDLQITVERKPDFLKKVVNNSETYILQIEFQTIDDSEMPYRMLEYFGMLYRKYRIPIHQYVVYIGKPVSQSNTGYLQTNRFEFTYETVSLREFDYELFINSDKPEEILLAILSNFKKSEPVAIIKRLIEKLQRISGSELQYGKYANQLQVLSRIRNLDEQTTKQLENMPLIFKPETLMRDPYYRKGTEDTKKELITDFIKLNILTPEQIATAGKVSISYVLEIMNEMNRSN
jgi:hypothetical protein